MNAERIKEILARMRAHVPIGHAEMLEWADEITAALAGGGPSTVEGERPGLCATPERPALSARERDAINAGYIALMELDSKMGVSRRTSFLANAEVLEGMLVRADSGATDREPEPELWRCVRCGADFDKETFSHERSEDDGRGNEIEIQCGPIEKVGATNRRSEGG